MPFVSSLILFIQLSIILIFVFSCTKMNEKIFDHNSKNEQNIVTSICKKTDASHFTVQNKRIIFKKKDGDNIELKHFKTLLSNGYYFCTKQTKNSLILD